MVTRELLKIEPKNTLSFQKSNKRYNFSAGVVGEFSYYLIVERLGVFELDANENTNTDQKLRIENTFSCPRSLLATKVILVHVDVILDLKQF